MRGIVIAAATALLALPLLACAPTADAFGYCTSVGIATRQCSEHIVCIGGGSYGTDRERCQYGVPGDGGVPPICDLIYCYWPPPPQ